MAIGELTKTRRVLLLAVLGVVTLGGIWLMGPIPQDRSYHYFAGEQMRFSIYNFWNTISNLPFLFVGLAGLVLCFKKSELSARLSWATLFAGVSMVAFGSAYYHQDPDNTTLVWDRLPMSIGFMGLFVALLSEYVDERSQVFLLLPLIALGAGSVWVWSEYDDLRLYIWVQFFPLLAIVALLTLFKARHAQNAYIWGALMFYILAKGLELGDQTLYDMSDRLVAGHPLKHLAAAMAVYLLYKMLKHRKPV